MHASILSPVFSTHPSACQSVHRSVDPPIHFHLLIRPFVYPPVHSSAYAQRIRSVSASSYYNAVLLCRNIMRGTCRLIYLSQQPTPLIYVVSAFIKRWHGCILNRI
jgi:hypothetical protein